MSYLQYGPVICTDGSHKGQIGYMDNDDTFNGEKCGVVFWGDPLSCRVYDYIPYEFLSNDISMHHILTRITKLKETLFYMEESKQKSILLQELSFVNTLFYEKHISAHTLSEKGIKLFISHFSKDKGYANSLYADLKESGCIHGWTSEI